MQIRGRCRTASDKGMVTMKTEEWATKPITSGEKALTSEQVEKLIKCIDDVQHRALIKLEIVTGIRREDIVGLMKKNVNATNSSVNFIQRKKRSNRNNGFHMQFIPDDVLNELKAYMKTTSGKWLFPASNPDRHISGRTAYNILRKYTRKAGIPDIPFHALRATCIKQCQRKGWSEAETARHVDDTIFTIQRHYATPSAEEMREASNKKAII